MRYISNSERHRLHVRSAQDGIITDPQNASSLLVLRIFLKAISELAYEIVARLRQEGSAHHVEAHEAGDLRIQSEVLVVTPTPKDYVADELRLSAVSCEAEGLGGMNSFRDCMTIISVGVMTLVVDTLPIRSVQLAQRVIVRDRSEGAGVDRVVACTRWAPAVDARLALKPHEATSGV